MAIDTLGLSVQSVLIIVLFNKQHCTEQFKFSILCKIVLNCKYSLALLAVYYDPFLKSGTVICQMSIDLS